MNFDIMNLVSCPCMDNMNWLLERILGKEYIESNLFVGFGRCVGYYSFFFLSSSQLSSLAGVAVGDKFFHILLHTFPIVILL